MTEPKEELAPMTPEVIGDDELLAEWVDVAIRLDPVAQARAGEIAQWREWLREACEPDLWKLVVEIEARCTERWEGLASVLVRYGFEAGRRGPPLRSGEVRP